MLGLIREEQGLAARALEALGVEQAKYEAELVRSLGLGSEVIPGQIPFTPRSKKSMELALREALSLGHNYIGTEHLLLGLVREQEGVGMRILRDVFDLDVEKIRSEVLRMLQGPTGRGQTKTYRVDLSSGEITLLKQLMGERPRNEQISGRILQALEEATVVEG